MPQKASAAKYGRAALDHQPAAGAEHPVGHHPVELDRVQLGGGRVLGVGEVGDDHVERARPPSAPRRRRRPRRPSTRGSASDRSLSRVRRRSSRARRRTAGSSSTSVTSVDVGVAQHLPQGEPVAAAQHQHPAVGAGHGRVDQRLVVAVLVDRGELQVAVEEQPHVGPAADRQRLGDDDVLVVAALGGDDRVVVEGLAGRHLEPPGQHQRHHQDGRGPRPAWPRRPTGPGPAAPAGRGRRPRRPPPR